MADMENECGVSDEAQRAAYQFVEELAKTPDGFEGPYPWWHGHAVRLAFCAGVRWDHKHPATIPGKGNTP